MAASGPTFYGNGRTSSARRSSRFFTVKYTTDEGTLRDIFGVDNLTRITDLPYTSRAEAAKRLRAKHDRIE